VNRAHAFRPKPAKSCLAAALHPAPAMGGVTGRVGAGIVVAWVTTVLLACGLRQDELECEEAVAVLNHCCPNFPDSQVSCVYGDVGCSTVYPDISIAESQCIRAESCDELVSSGVCARTEQQAAAHPQPGGASDAGGWEGVCP
jgi:hypothetical protein